MKIAQNAKTAREIWEPFAHNKKLCECFHLRPTKSGITLVSTLPYAPMRGISLSAAAVTPLLNEITKKINVLLGLDTKKALALLESWNFKLREIDVYFGLDEEDAVAFLENRNFEILETVSFMEENAQALFIKGMILKQEMYEGIHFVASELELAGKSSRFDIVGYKDNTLYIFEMKKGRKVAGLAQTAGYAKLINENKHHFLSVLTHYPHCSIDNFNKIIPVAVMGYAANAVSQLTAKAKEAEVALWFYERSITLRKTNV